MESYGRQSILLVDDSLDVHDFVDAIFANVCEIVHAEDGHAALASMREGKPDLIVTDLSMPGMSGEEFIRCVRRDPGFGSIPIIVLTGKNNDQLRVRLLGAGAHDYCLKPLSAEELGVRVTNALQIKRTRDVLEQELEIRGATLETLLKESQARKAELKQALTETNAVTEQLRLLTRRLQAVQEQERVRISREIHDEFGQALTVLKLQCFDLTTRLEVRDPEAAEIARSLTAQVTLLGDRARRIAHELRPSILQDFGLEEAVRTTAAEFEERTGIRCSCEVGSLEPLTQENATVVFRVLQEALTNVARHAKAQAVIVALKQNADNEVVLSIRDDGIGIDERNSLLGTSLGLTGMRERALSIGGRFSIEADELCGSVLRLQIPRFTPGDAGAQR